jgi:autotransporter-associated beta strand protein
MVIITAMAMLVAPFAQAASYYWDSNGTTTGAGATPTGTWGLDSFWNTDATGGAAGAFQTATLGTDDLFFSAGTDAVNPYTNGLNSATQIARLVTFEDGTVTLNNGTLSLGHGGGITVSNSTVIGATISSGLTLSGKQTFNVAAGQTLTLNTGTFTRNAGSTLNVLSTGTVTPTMTGLATGSLVNNIIGPWASFGSGASTTYATINGSDNIIGLGYTGGADGSSAADANAFTSATANYDLTTAAVTLSASRTANTFRSAGAGGAIDLSTTAVTQNLTLNGILATGASGTLTIQRTAGSGTLVIGAANELVIGGSQAVTISAPISGSAKSLTYSGSSTLNLSAGTFTGGLNVNSGTLNAAFTTYTSANLAAGATWNYVNAFGNNPTFSNPFTINGAFIKTGNGSMTFGSGATISGSGSLSFSGQVTIAINSDNPNFTGTIIEASQGGGGFNIGHNGALGAGLLVFGNNNNDIRSTVGGPGYVAAYNSTYRFDASRTFGGNGVNLNFGSGAVTLNSSPTLTISSQTTFGGSIGQTGGTRTLTKSGAGTLVLGGSTSNTYGGLTTMAASQGGILQLAKTGTAQAIAGGGLTIGGADNSLAKVTYTGGSSDMMGTGTVTINGRSRFDFNGHTDTIGNVSIVNAGAISDVNSILNTAGTGNLTIGTLGITPVAGLTTQINAGNTGTITLGGNVTFTAANTGQARFTGQTLALGAATRTFTVGAGTGLGQDLLVDASISGTGVGLTKAGTGRLALSSAANTYDGLTTVSDGTLKVITPATLGNGSGGLTVAANKSFIYAPTVAGAMDLGSGVLTLSSGTTTAIGTALGGTAGQSAITSSSAASLAGTGVVNIYLIPGVAPVAGTHNLITAASGLAGGTYTLGAVYNNTDLTLSSFTRSATAISVDVAAATPLSGNVYWKGGLTGNTGVWSASNGSNLSNWQQPDGTGQPLAPGATADLVFSATTTPGTMAGMTLGANMSVNSLKINNTASAFALTADGNTLTLGTGGITIASGVQASSIATPVILAAAQTWLNNSANALTVNGGINNNGNLLTIDGSGSFNLNSGVMSGNGGITKNGTGILVMGSNPAAAHTYSGTTTINGGTVMFGTLPAASGLTLNGGVYEEYWTATFTRTLGAGAGQVQILGGVSGFSENGSTGMTIKLGNGTATVVWGALGEGSAAGFFNPSTLVLQSAAAQTGSTLDFQNGIDLNGATRTIQVNKTSNLTSGATVSGVIKNSNLTTAAGLTKTGPGKLTLSAVNIYNGDTTVNSGTLQLNNVNTSNQNSTVTIAATGATLNLNFGTLTNTVDKLFIGTTQKDPGVYGSADISQITGTGKLKVKTGRPKGTIIRFS